MRRAQWGSILSLLPRRLSPSSKLWSVRFALAFTLCCVLSFTFNRLQITQNISQYMDGKEQLAHLRRTNQALKQEVELLELELSETSTPSWIEKQARLRGMIFEGEEVFVLESTLDHERNEARPI